MKHRYIFISFLVAFLLQSVFVLNFGIQGKSPDFLLCVTILFSFYYEENIAFAYMLIFGLLTDINFSILSGPKAVILALIALIMTKLKLYFYRENLVNLLMISVLGTTVHHLFQWIIIRIFKGTYTFMYMLKDLPISLIMNAIVMLILYFAVAKRTKQVDKDKLF